MGRTSIKNRLILSFLALLFIVMVVVGVVNRITEDFYGLQLLTGTETYRNLNVLSFLFPEYGINVTQDTGQWNL